MNIHHTSRTTVRHPIAYAATTAVTGLLLLAATACSTKGAAPDASVAPTSVAPPSTAPPPATTPPPTPPPEPPTTSSPPTSVKNDEATRAVVRDVLDAHHEAGEFVGAHIAVLGRDGTITEATTGTTTVDPASGPVGPAVPWNIGSVTKTFVAVVVLQLAEEGRIDLDAGIDRFLPDLPGAGRITPRQLLQHTSGLGEYNNQPAVLNDMRRHWTPSELIAVAEAAGRVGEPGGPHHYSNTNYIVLGEIIERVTGHSWSDEVRTRIVEPLGLTGTSAITDQHPTGYKLIDGAFVDTTFSADPSVGGAAGGMDSTGRDLLTLAAALRDGRLLSPESRAAMRSFVPGEDLSQYGIVYGYGLGIEQYANDTVVVDGHMGTGEAQSAFLGYDVTSGIAVAVMTNTATPGPQAIMAMETLMALAKAG